MKQDQAASAADRGSELTDGLGRMVGDDLAALIDPGTLAACIEEAQYSDMGVTARELAVARALLFRVSGSALLDGDKRAIKDAGTLYRMVCAANGLLIGRPGGTAA